MSATLSWLEKQVRENVEALSAQEILVAYAVEFERTADFDEDLCIQRKTVALKLRLAAAEF